MKDQVHEDRAQILNECRLTQDQMLESFEQLRKSWQEWNHFAERMELQTRQQIELSLESLARIDRQREQRHRRCPGL